MKFFLFVMSAAISTFALSVLIGLTLGITVQLIAIPFFLIAAAILGWNLDKFHLE